MIPTHKTKPSAYRKFLCNSISMGSLLIMAASDPVFAEETDQTVIAVAAVTTAANMPIHETNRYFMRMMTQIFDGSKEFSHTQVAEFARMRKDNLSWTMMDFGDGAVVITEPDTLSVSGFKNTTKAELGVLYNYDTKTIEGESQVASFHNTYVRPQLNQGPALGSNANWTTQMPLSALGVPALAGQQIKMELSRDYFTYQGEDYVLLQYAIPALRFDSGNSTTVVHWGRGFALTDPGFGNIYASAALHRSVADEGEKEARPYRYFRSAFASDNNGKMMLDIKNVPAVAEIYDDYFSDAALRVIPFTDNDTADQRPMKLAANLDVMALSIAENGANDSGTTAAAQMGDQRGNETAKVMSNVTTGSSLAGNAYTWTNIVAGSSQEQEIFLNLTDRMQGWKNESEALVTSLNASARRMLELENAVKNPKGTWELTPGAQAIEDIMTQKGAAFQEAAQTYATKLKNVDFAPPDQKISYLKNAWQEYQVARLDNQYAILGYETILTEESSYQFVSDTIDRNAAEALIDEAKNFRQIESALAETGSKGAYIVSEVKTIPPTRFQTFAGRLGTGLEFLGHAMNGYTIGSSVANLQKQGSQNLATGQAPGLTRTYGSSLNGDLSGNMFGGLLDLGLALDLASMVGAVASGDIYGAASTAAAVATGSISDILISAKGLKDINVVNTEAAKLGHQLAIRRKEQYFALSDENERLYNESISELDQEITELDAYADEADQALRDRMVERDLDPDREPGDENWTDPRFDADTGLPKPAYWAYLKENDPQALRNMEIDPDAPVGGWPPGGPATELSDEELIAGLANEINKEDYPTAPPRDPDATQEDETSTESSIGQTSELSPEQLEAIETAQRQQIAKEKLEAYQKQKLEEMNNKPEAERGKPLTVSELTISELKKSDFNIEPVKFIPPQFDEDNDLFDENGNLKKIGPDDFEMTAFDAPDISKIEWTNFDDDDYPGGDKIPAWTYENMSGIVATDLGPWEEWLATQDIRKLTQLALQAGYPNLASALTDAENIIRLSQDQGYRQWALRAPSHGPSMLGRWAMKRSTVALGDILNASRGIFSSGGFSDVGITSLNLAYLLRDFGLQDDDFIEVQISQFGRNLVTERVILTNAGNNLNVNLRRGVAQLVITALNEGAISPNTAEININNVVRGQADQTYSLETGETAVLRIEAGATQ